MSRQQPIEQILDEKFFLCVGLDPDIRKIPPHLLHEEDPIFTFNKAITDAATPYCVACRPNLAFYECRGVEGLTSFEKAVSYLKTHYPNHFITADAKRGDTGNTSTMYTKAFSGEYDIDALTIAPYMGEDSVTPFLEYENKWVAVLTLASNKRSYGSRLTENKDGEKLFEEVIRASQSWGTDQSMVYVASATQDGMLEVVRKAAPHHFLLVSGVDAQGESLQGVCQYGMTKDCGSLVNSSRGIICASQGENFADTAIEGAIDLQQEMEKELKRLSSRR